MLQTGRRGDSANAQIVGDCVLYFEAAASTSLVGLSRCGVVSCSVTERAGSGGNRGEVERPVPLRSDRGQRRGSAIKVHGAGAGRQSRLAGELRPLALHRKCYNLPLAGLSTLARSHPCAITPGHVGRHATETVAAAR